MLVVEVTLDTAGDVMGTGLTTSLGSPFWTETGSLLAAAEALCRVIFKEPVQALILFWASRCVIPCALIPSMLRTTSPILTCA